jgi:tetratricopeptide (TPR) repeat protein
MNADLTTALQLHQARRYADAARCYHEILTREPENAEALHLFGVMHHQCGHCGRAVELIGRAAALRPETAAFHANLAEAYRGLGDHDRAIESCRTALRLKPRYPEAANNLGLALHALGRHAEAEDQFRAALDARTDFALARNNLGTLLRELGRKDEALDAFRVAIGLDPALALARANLGQALVEAGRAEEALEHCQEAVRLQPDLAAAHTTLGNAYRDLEQWALAHSAYAEALRLCPGLGDARIHANLGRALHWDGKLAEGIACIQRALEVAPEDVEIWQIKASAHAADEDYAAVVLCCERIAALKPEQAESHTELGWALQEEGRLTEAFACYNRALELDPNSVDALLKKGTLHEEQGAMADAEASYRRARAVDLEAPGPLACLATLLRGNLSDADRDAISSLLDDPALDGWPRANLLFGLAQVCDARGEYTEAAACAASANALALNQRKKQNRVYDPAEHSRFVDRQIEGFTAELFDRLSNVGDETRQPVFVFGMPRSGTTLVEQILASHTRVDGAGELRLVRQTFDAIPAVVGRAAELQPCLAALDERAVRELSRRYQTALDAIWSRSRPGPVAERIVDKMPDNYLYLGLLAIAFPRATLIHVRRDARDAAVSCWMTNFRSIRWANDPEHLACRFREHDRMMAHWRNVLPVPMHEVWYEKLVGGFEDEARQLVAACGLDWEPTCLEFHKISRPVRTASVTQVRQPLYRKAVARWKHYDAPLADLFARVLGC